MKGKAGWHAENWIRQTSSFPKGQPKLLHLQNGDGKSYPMSQELDEENATIRPDPRALETPPFSVLVVCRFWDVDGSVRAECPPSGMSSIHSTACAQVGLS